eukprot:TRINITY_DN47776_c0_g1_i5.p1 TRINITY_DN47776_c0_g1~~TRINITY_DN47776_c0_g1_i5.p1  ORF type:complete len:149 (+),score=10.18 TRINITY_DN47776_c0_g1_i5:792-1238(+)
MHNLACKGMAMQISFGATILLSYNLQISISIKHSTGNYFGAEKQHTIIQTNIYYDFNNTLDAQWNQKLFTLPKYWNGQLIWRTSRCAFHLQLSSFFFAKTSIYVFVVHICKGFLILEMNGIKLMNSETRAIIIDDILALLYPKYHWEV